MGKVSSFPGTNTLFEGQQINGHGQIKRGPGEERQKREHRKGDH
jgi:hypothetical protein